MRFNNAAIAAAGLVGILGVAAIATTSGAGATPSEITLGPTPASTMVLRVTTLAPTTTAAPTTTMPAPTTTAAPVPTTAAPVEAPATTAAPVEAPTTTAAPVEAPTTTEAPAAEAAPVVEEAAYQPTSTVAGDTSAEYEFLADTNATRASIGVAALTMDSSLQAYARNQAQAMADAGTIYHSDIATLLGTWSTVGENVGVGPSVLPIHNALVASPLHYRNLADSTFTNIGIGVVHGNDGRIYTAHVFGA